MRKVNNEHPHFSAARMAASDMTDALASLKEQYGHFGPPDRPSASATRIANAPPEVQNLLSAGHSREEVDRIAKMIEGGS